MDNLSLIESFSEFKDEKFIDRVTLMSILEEVFRNTLKRKFGDDENFDVHLYLLKNLFVELIYDQGRSTILKIATPSKDKIIQNYHLDKKQLNRYLQG